MKRLIGLITILVLVPGVYAYPRHIDPSTVETAEPDPQMLFNVFHNIFDGMILENYTIQDEWFDWAGEVYSVEDLDELLKMYGDQLRVQSFHLNQTKHFLGLAVDSLGEYDIESAKTSFLTSLVHLQASNESIPVLVDSTLQIGDRLESHPEILLQDIEELRQLIADYQELAHAMVIYSEGGELADEEIERLKEVLEGLVDPGYLENIGDVPNPLTLTRTRISLDVSPAVVHVGEPITVQGYLRYDEGALPNRDLRVTFGEHEYVISTDSKGDFNETLSMPYIYQDSVEVRCIYWPNTVDMETYSPATSFEIIDLIYYTPTLSYSYSEALPGKTWNVSGAVTFNTTGVEGLKVRASLLGVKRFTECDQDGSFILEVPVNPLTPLEETVARVSVDPKEVFSGVEDVFSLTVSKLPVLLVVEAPDFTLSGNKARISCYVESGGVPLDDCKVRVTGDGIWLDRTVNGSASVSIFTDLFSSDVDYPVTITVTPKEPWIMSATYRGSLSVYSSFALVWYFLLLGAVAYYNRFIHKPKEVVPEQRRGVPVMDPVIEPIVVDSRSFSSIFERVLMFVSSVSGVQMLETDTIREYLEKLGTVFSGRVFELFSSFSLWYERWLYGRPYDVDLDSVDELAVLVMEDSDEV